MRVKPAPGLSVRNPETKQLLPADGIEVPDDSILWNKILNDGDVVRMDAAKASAATAAAKDGEKE
ncbi:hypothetical protein F4827_001710 [Paraburkholderia bannensis]|uniref:DUF2635 domain-containing protein n=1 Tax=Paraburkholderia bannensis TaxID=765414 RepID=A0A7W9WS27_9BURK|nr:MULTISPECIES: DUF2635 domain-containing protein [Paraburkholderia]MBB3256865.1 hypothetical protein [Paraburkholderia sp. WP4_3_2]MBB6101862.1 hypothetical protein [Paraburkholderia bannensis]